MNVSYKKLSKLFMQLQHVVIMGFFLSEIRHLIQMPLANFFLSKEAMKVPIWVVVISDGNKCFRYGS